jgi:DNA-binding PadR family transcriptional regulator
MNTSNFFKGELKYLILKSLIEEPLHGYSLMKKIEKNSMGLWKPKAGSLYPALSSLKNDGLIEIKHEEYKGRRRKIYKITKAGKEKFDQLSKNVEEIEKMFIECSKNNWANKNCHEDAVYLLETFHKLLLSPGFENYRSTMLEFSSFLRSGKISKKLEDEFAESFKQFLHKVSLINEKARK